MLLRESSLASGLRVDAAAVLDGDHTGDAGLPHGRLLLAFATAANRAANPIRHDEPDALLEPLDRARAELGEAVGDAGLIEAAATVAAFNGLVRVADGTGIELDEGVVAASVDERRDLALDDLAGAANTRRLDREATTVDGIASLYH